MELVDLVRPTFMTLEEVTTFLLTSLKLDHKEKGGSTRQVRCPLTSCMVLPASSKSSLETCRADQRHSRCGQKHVVERLQMGARGL